MAFQPQYGNSWDTNANYSAGGGTPAAPTAPGGLLAQQPVTGATSGVANMVKALIDGYQKAQAKNQGQGQTAMAAGAPPMNITPDQWATGTPPVPFTGGGPMGMGANGGVNPMANMFSPYGPGGSASAIY